jgi:hypothetical protein
MRLLHAWVLVLAAGCFLRTARGESAFLVVRTDLACRLSVDGETRGVLKAGEEVRVSVAAGEHHLTAAPVDGPVAWEATVELKGDAQEVTIPLRAAVERAEVKKNGYWVDPQTQLMWPAADNGFGVSAAQAAYYCRTLTLAGHTDWTLPTIDQLRDLFGGPANESGHHVVGPIKLTGWQWSESAGQEPGQQWALDFGDGARASVVTGDSGLNRALCVRRAGK